MLAAISISFWTVLSAIIALFVVSGILSCIKVIKNQEAMVIEQFGKYNRTLSAGLNFIIPVMERARPIHWRYQQRDISGVDYAVTKERNTIDLREQVFDFSKQSVITKDNVSIEIDAMLYYLVTDAHDAVYKIANLPDAIEKLCKTSLRNVAGNLTLDECLTSRDQINGELLVIMDEATDPWGVKVSRVELKDITPPHDVQQAMEKQMRAERERRAVILTAEGEKKSMILESEGIRESQIRRAEGEKQALVLEATGQAEARLKVATAEAGAIKLVTEGLAGAKTDPAQYLVAIRYLETLKEMTSGKDNKVVYVPYEATGVIGSLGGIKEMLSGLGKS